ncbi:MAG: GNAT family N-acetyltransferase, partial [Candidatus Eisenbacteria bacterium]|nr:GNAT family N-acetyltransferase [Candidatus Eisenbacteria bacterium]
SHFFLDPGFPVDRVEALYAKWVDTALDRQQTFVVIEHEGAICGVFIYEMDDRTTRFGRKYAVWKLADVDSRVRGKGLGMRLFHATVMSAADQGADAIDSSLAVHNVASQNIHIRLGFRLITSVYTFHRWFEPKEAR